MEIHQSKFRHCEKRHGNAVDFESLRGPIVVEEKHLNDRPSSILLGGSIRAQYEAKYGSSSERRGIKIVSRQDAPEDVRHHGKMYIPAKVTKDHEFVPSVKQFHSIKDPTSASFMVNKGWTGKIRLTSSTSELHGIEDAMGRKQRLTSEEHRRNDIPAVSRGDKYYKEADRERDFFKSGGLIPGASIAASKTKTQLGKDLNASSSHPCHSKPPQTYQEKRRKELLSDELKQLRDLNNCSERLGQEIPSWEQKTGLYLVKPEDESY